VNLSRPSAFSERATVEQIRAYPDSFVAPCCYAAWTYAGEFYE
jgi:hypothetical protein